VQKVLIAGRGGAADGAVADSDLGAHRRYGALRGRLVLVRPDGYIAGTAPLERPESLEGYLHRLGGGAR
jgi:hypothetical protein